MWQWEPWWGDSCKNLGNWFSLFLAPIQWWWWMEIIALGSLPREQSRQAKSSFLITGECNLNQFSKFPGYCLVWYFICISSQSPQCTYSQQFHFSPRYSQADALKYVGIERETDDIWLKLLALGAPSQYHCILFMLLSLLLYMLGGLHSNWIPL